MIDFPKLRLVEAIPLEEDNEQHFALRDPSGIVEEMIVVTGEALFLLQYFDGRNSLQDIRAEYQRTLGTLLPEEKLLKLIADLDHLHFLESETFRAYLIGLEKQFRSQSTRAAAHAGVSYAKEPPALRTQLEQYYMQGGGASRSDGTSHHTQQVLGMIAPHIDIRLGGACYTFAYRELAESRPVDVFVILGTGHNGLHNCYSCLPQDFETPLGLVKHDADFINTLAQQHSYELFGEPLAHRTEHTIEFQAVFLQHLLGGKQSFSIVPILCSYSYLMMTDTRFQRERRIIEAFVEALRETCAQHTAQGKRVCVTASVDFSHVGPRYGDPQIPDADFLSTVRTADFMLLDAISQVDVSRFVSVNAHLEDRYRVCGFAPIHTLLAATNAKTGKLLKYEQALVDDNKSVVSYASAVLY